MPEKNNEKNIFRIAAVLYKDGNYVATRKTTIRKFVETVFIDTDNDSISPILILQHIEKNYKISFSEEEIIESLNESYFIHCGEGYSLEKKRYNQLKNILNNQNNIYTYICISKSNNICFIISSYWCPMSSIVFLDKFSTYNKKIYK